MFTKVSHKTHIYSRGRERNPLDERNCKDHLQGRVDIGRGIVLSLHVWASFVHLCICMSMCSIVPFKYSDTCIE